MRKRVEKRDRETDARASVPKEDAPKVQVPVDVNNEATVVAAAYLFPELRTRLVRQLQPDVMQQREHRDAWIVFGEATRRQLVIDSAIVEQLSTPETAAYLRELAELKPQQPANLDHHIAALLWDHTRVEACRGPIPSFIEALRDPREEPARVRALARAVGTAFDGHDDMRHLLDPRAVVREQMMEIERRVDGVAIYTTGLPGLDLFTEDFGSGDDRIRQGDVRMVPGTAPGLFTVLTGVSGSGKTTTAANMVLGIAFPQWRVGDFDAPGRKVLYGAWEVKGGMTLEILACISLRWRRSDLMTGRGIIATPEGRRQLHERMETIASRVRFLANPFRRRAGERSSNERNLDTFQGYIAAAGCPVVFADLWKRLLVRADPEEEEEALVRTQAMAEEERIHLVALQQQRMKDIEQRADKRPTREGIKGTGAWVEVPDNIIGIHRPALFKHCDDNTQEQIVLKQRYGAWPMAVEFTWCSATGFVSGGRPVDYDRPGETNEFDFAAGGGGSALKKARQR